MKKSIKDLSYSSDYSKGQKNGMKKGVGGTAALLLTLFAAVAGVAMADTNKYKEKLGNDVRNGGANNR